MSTPRPRTATLLAIGDEVLRGEIVNGNAAFLADRLFDLGYVLRAHRVISDEVADIRATLEQLGETVDLVLVTGGLGPTDDDRTVDVVSSLLGVTPVIHEPSAEVMKKGFAARGYELTPNNLRQVRVPAGALALTNGAGIAPGFCVKLGRADAYFFPGVPREMQRIFGDHVVPRLTELQTTSGAPLPAVRTYHVYGMGESHIDHRLAGLVDSTAVDQDPAVFLHYRTAAPENHVKIIVRGSDPARNRQTLDALDQEVRRRLGAVVYGVDEETFPLAVARSLEAAGATLALAESCTGGYAGQILTSEPGASRVFAGAVVSYANEVKVKALGVRPETLERAGAVSEACAAEMAEGARTRLGATIGISITGIAGSAKDAVIAVVPELPATEQSPGGKPVGTVCFGVSGPRGNQTETKIFVGGRERIRKAAAYFALDLARRHFD